MFEHLDILDEKYVEIVANAIAEDRISCAVQSVRSVLAPAETLYGECLARLTGPDGKVYAASVFAPCLNTLRETSMLDRHMINLVLNLLEADPMAVLGCNLSADSLANKAMCHAVLEQLHHRSHLARQLVLEVTETQELSRLSFCIEMLAEVRGLGYRIALNDFGAGFASPKLLHRTDFDIIKIEETFIHDIRPSAEGRNSLQNIIGFASSFAPLIVVKGVDTVDQIDAARAAGATHFQGYFFSPVARQSRLLGLP